MRHLGHLGLQTTEILARLDWHSSRKCRKWSQMSHMSQMSQVSAIRARDHKKIRLPNCA